MGNITLLDQATIDKIAAGEVVERPSSVVKELVENAIDAGSSAVTVEIKDGGITFIRISDNGCGIDPSDIKTAFLRHSTSKIRSVEDLLTISSLGFRGEALSSISAVSMVELLTKTKESLCGIRYTIEGGVEKSIEEAASPDGTTFFVRNLFYNTPARKKFLKSSMTEAGYIHELMIRLALSHPEISFKFVNNGQTKLHSSGNHSLKDVIYQVYGRDISNNLVEIDTEENGVRIKGYIGKPNVFRGNRNFETYFVNGRYIKSNIIAKGIEDAYKGYLMQHQYPFCVLQFTMDGGDLDVNVHPTKMELRFSNQQALYDFVFRTVREGLDRKEYIPQVTVEEPKKVSLAPKPMTQPKPVATSKPVMPATKPAMPVTKPEPVQKPAAPQERNLDYFLAQMRERVKADHASRENKSPYQQKFEQKPLQPVAEKKVTEPAVIKEERKSYAEKKAEVPVKPTPVKPVIEKPAPAKEPHAEAPQQMELFDKKLLAEECIKEHKIIGQLFETYWMVEFDEKLFIIDQHAAHEKVLYERTLKGLKNKEHTSQLLSPPMVLSLSMQEEALLKKYMQHFTDLGYEIEHFGGMEYQICAVPGNLYNINKKELFIEILDNLSELSGRNNPELILEKIASMSCKAAVKGNMKMSRLEMENLIKELLTLDNPYQCPHGRPTIISMSKYEIEKKFKRIV
ncbi:MAG: DNA mismatch repair endonuclease MutL [Lachnospiraceae bacterium]|nr:DNA mismatch repair endonuclease MutL [Lachnospiraceae bacterium]